MRDTSINQRDLTVHDRPTSYGPSRVRPLFGLTRRTAFALRGPSFSPASLLAGLLFLSGCGTGRPAMVETGRVVPYPILLVHGFGSGPGVWESDGAVGYLRDLGLRYGGTVRASQSPSDRATSSTPRPLDFFTVGFSDPYGDLEAWGRELASVIDRVLIRTGAQRVVLIAHSAGGLACRRYLVDHPFDHHVDRLVTIASPHTGTELAQLSALKVLIDSRPDLAVLRPVMRRVEEAAGIPLSAPILAQLQPVEHNAWLQRLNTAPHPADVSYAAIIVEHGNEVSLWRDLETDLGRIARDPVNSTFVNRLLQRVLEVLNGEEWHTGDGVVLAERQRLSNVAYFELENVPVDETVVRSRTHQDALGRHFEILSAISGLPEVVQVRHKARLFSRSARLEIAYMHELGLATRPEAVAVSADDRSDRQPVAVGDPALVQQADAALVRLEIGPFSRRSIRRIDLELRPPQGSVIYVLPLADRPSSFTPGTSLESSDRPNGARLVIGTVSGVPESLDPGPVTRWRGADLFVTVATSDGPLLQTEVLADVSGTVARFDAPFELLNVDPLRTRLFIRIWDEDVVSDTLIGTAVLEPGRWPVGAVSLETDTGLDLTVELDWTAEPTRHELPPVFWR